MASNDASYVNYCGGTCLADSKACGMLNMPTSISVYNSGTGNFDFSLTQNANGMLTVSSQYASAYFSADFGDGSPLVSITDLTSPGYSLQLTAPVYAIPGTYNITVVGKLLGTNAMVIQKQVAIFSQQATPSIDLVSCPVIAYTGQPFLCNVSVSYLNDSHSYSLTFSDNSNVSTILSNIGNMYRSLGTSVPKGSTYLADSNGTSIGDEIILINHPITSTGQISAVDLMPFLNDTFTITLQTANCAGLKYCMYLGTCLASCPFDPSSNSFSCHENTFYHLSDRCNTNGSLGTAPTWSVVTTGTASGTTNKTARFTFTNQTVQPGYILKVQGSVSRRLQTGPGGDLVNNVPTDFHHYAMMYIKEFMNLSVSHTCMTILENSTLSVTDTIVTTNVYKGPPPSTMCERNISSVDMTLIQTEIFNYNSTINLATNTYFVWVGCVFNLIATFTEAGPIYFNLTSTPTIDGITTEQFLFDYPAIPGVQYNITFNRTITTPGNYSVELVAYNSHNLIPDPLTGQIKPGRIHNFSILAEFPISPTWMVTANSKVGYNDTFLIPNEVPSVTFKDSNTSWTFPTSATVNIDWGDGTPIQILDFVNPGTAQPIVNHTFAKAGVFVVNCSIRNAVSEILNVTTTITVYQHIDNFKITNMYLPSIITGMKPGFGKQMNQFPIDRDLIFVPTMTSGTVENFVLQFTSNGSLIKNFTVADMFNPTTIQDFSYSFNFSTVLNLTVIAVNKYESYSVDLYVEMIGIVRGLHIDDFSIVTKAGELKTFHFSFVSFAGATCLIINFGDLGDFKAIGNQESCRRNYSFIPYDPTIQLENEFNVTHVYASNQMYNISAIAFNDLNKDDYLMSFPVTDIRCASPTAAILGQALDYLTPQMVFKGKDNVITAVSTLNCNVTLKTKKRWQIFNVNSTNGEQGTAINVMNILPTWNTSELIITKAFLPSGNYYLCVYTIAMYDPPVLDVKWSFQNHIKHYIYVNETPLVARLTSIGITEVTRGLPQSVLLQPALYSIDPDYPTSPSFNISWKCRSAGEICTASKTPLPLQIGGSGTGCFGNGPGYVNYNSSQWTIFGKDFVGLGSYEIVAEVINNTRNYPVSMILNIVHNAVPILRINCSSDILCIPNENGVGVYINPNNRLGMIATCISACANPPTFNWLAYNLQDNSQLNFSPNDVPIGTNGSDFSLATSFFNINPTLKQFKLVVTSRNGNSTGSSALIVYVNQRPVNGICNFDMYHGTIILNTFTLTCSGWVDPESIGIDMYIVRLLRDGVTPETLMQQKHHALPEQIFTLSLPVGVYTVEVTIQDLWGATTIYNVTQPVTIEMMTENQFKSLDMNALIASCLGGGDTNRLNMLINAQNSIIDNAPWLDVNNGNISDAELQSRMLLINNMYSQEISALQSTMNLNTQGGAEVAAGILADIMNKASETPNSVLTIDLFARGDIYDILDKLVTQIGKLPIGTPNDLTKLIESVATIAGGLVVGVQEVTTPGCKRIPPKDSSPENSDNVQYDTEVKSIDMVVPSDPMDAIKCNVLDLTSQQDRLQMPRLQGLMDKMSKYVLMKQVSGETLSISTSNNMTVVNKVLPGNELAGFHPCGRSAVEFPDNFCPTGDCSDAIGLGLKEWPTLTYTSTPSSYLLTGGSRILDVNLYNKRMETVSVTNFNGDITLHLYRTLYSRGNSSVPNAQPVAAINETETLSIPVMYTMFLNTKIGASISIQITPFSQNISQLILMVMKDEQPTLGNFDNFTFVEDISSFENGTYTYFIECLPGVNNTGNYYIGIAELKDNITSLEQIQNKASLMSFLKKPMTVNYDLNIFASGCYFFNGQDWDSNGVQAVGSDVSSVICKTNHLTPFGGGLFVMPNTIDFSFVFAHMGFSDNLTIYVTLIVCYALLALLMIWAKWQDKKDITKLGASPLPDNMATDKYLYEIMVFTGSCTEAQTDSTVQFILSGDFGDTEVRTFGDNQRKIFRKGAIDIFIMAVPKFLGPLSYLRIWHDNSGIGPNTSWNLNFIVFRDIQTGRKYEFICNDWLAVEKSDGQIERILGVAGREDKDEFGYLFQNTANMNLSDGHLWFSIFMRPPRSRFTRCQRVATCFAILFLAMLTNAMWYTRVPSQSVTGAWTIGPFNISPAQIAVGVMSNLIVFPPTFLIAFLFKHSKPKVLRKSRVQDALARASKDTMKAKLGDSWEEGKEEDEIKAEKTKSELKDSNKKLKLKKKNKKRKISFPWWCSYVAWLLVVVCIAASTFFLLSYGIMFGNEKTTKWISSLFISLFSSILCLQPFKVIVTAMFMSLILKNVELDEDDADCDEESPELQSDELWLFEGEKQPMLGYATRIVHKDLLAELRRRRLNEIENAEMIKELVGYGMFLLILLIISYGERDPNSYYLKNSLMLSFVNFGQIDGTDFTQISTTDDFWNYLPEGLIRPLRADFWYNGKPPYQLRGYLNDYNNRIMGYATIRQIRAKKNTCSIPSVMKSNAKQCSGFSQMVEEEDRNFCAQWKIPNTLTSNSSDCRIPEFQYKTAAEVQSLPLWGQKDWYGGGGYVISLSGSTVNLIKRFTYLHQNFWIDKMTRAVIIEFSTYNSQVNLFGICTLMIEYLPGSGITSSYRFDAISLFASQDSYGSVIVVCQILFCIFVAFFTLRELRSLCKMKKKYFDSYWSYAEIAMILVSYCAIMLYFLREYVTTNAVKVFKNTYGNGYVRMNYAAAISEYFGYTIAFLVFVGTIKFIKLLRFSKRMGFLSATLRKCWDDLIGFMLAFCICFLSFVLMFFFLIGSDVVDFSTFTGAITTCFSMMLGKFQFNQMAQANSFAPVMFFVFVLCTSWVLVNLLLTLIMKSFEEVKNEITNMEDPYQITEYVFGQFKKFIGRKRDDPTPVIPPVLEFDDMKDTINKDVNELPSKVDKFLEYVNNAYFDGTMDLKSKGLMKESLSETRGRKILGLEGDVGVNRIDFRNSRQENPATPRSIFNSGE